MIDQPRSKTARISKLSRGAVLASIALAIAATVAGSASGRSADTKTLVVDTSFAIRSADPEVSGQATSKLISRVRFDTLLTYTAGVTATPQPDLATGFKVSPHAKVFTFSLRKNVHFADGTPLTSADVVFSLQRALNLKQDASQILTGLSFSAPDPYTVVVKSNVPNPSVPLTLANPTLGIVNSKLAIAHGATDAANAATTDTASAWFSSSASQGVGSGPYTLASYDPASQITLGQNKKWWQGKAHWSSIVLRNMVAATESLSIQQGTHEIALDLGTADIPTVSGSKNAKIYVTQSPSAFIMTMNANPSVSSATSNPKFQAAVRDAIDYKTLKKLGGYSATQLASVLPPGVPGALQPKDAVQRNVAKAQQEFAASGVTSTPTLEYPSDRSPGGVSFATVAQEIQQNLQDAGIKINLQGEPIATAVARELTGQVQMALIVNVPNTYDGVELARFTPGGGIAAQWNWTSAPDVQRGVLKARFIANPTARAAAWQSVQTLMNQESPYVPLFVPTQVIVYTHDLTGVVFNPLWVLDLSRVRSA